MTKIFQILNGKCVGELTYLGQQYPEVYKNILCRSDLTVLKRKLLCGFGSNSLVKKSVVNQHELLQQFKRNHAGIYVLLDDRGVLRCAEAGA